MSVFIHRLTESIRLRGVCWSETTHLPLSLPLQHTTHTCTELQKGNLGPFGIQINWLDPTSLTHTRLTPWVHRGELSTFRRKPTLLYSPTVGTVSHAGLDLSAPPPYPCLHECVFGRWVCIELCVCVFQFYVWVFVCILIGNWTCLSRCNGWFFICGNHLYVFPCACAHLEAS